MLLPKFGSQTSDMDVYGARSAVVVVSPHSAEKGLPCEYLPRVGGQKPKELVFHIGQVNRLAINGRLISLEIEC